MDTNFRKLTVDNKITNLVFWGATKEVKSNITTYDYNFYITNKGHLFAKGAKISGTVSSEYFETGEGGKGW
jgi:hypothetical protein